MPAPVQNARSNSAPHGRLLHQSVINLLRTVSFKGGRTCEPGKGSLAAPAPIGTAVTSRPDTGLEQVLVKFARTLVTDFPIQGILDHLVKRIVDVLPVTAARGHLDLSGH